MKRFWGFAGSLLALGFASIAQAATVTDVGYGTTYTWLTVNDAHQLAGYETVGPFAARWSGGVATRVGAPGTRAVAIDGAGNVYGNVALPLSQFQPLWWDLAGTVHTAAPAASFGGFSDASENGTSAGRDGVGPFLRSAAGVVSPLPGTGGAMFVNDAGHAVLGTATGYAFWNGTSVVPLPLDFAARLNVNDDVPGTIGTFPGPPGVWNARTGVTTPLPMPANNPGQVILQAMSDDGTVVGNADYAGLVGRRGVVWQSGVPRFLDDLMPAGSGWTKTFVHDISNRGVILGSGEKPAGTIGYFILDLNSCAAPALRTGGHRTAALTGCGPSGIDWTVPQRLLDSPATKAAGGAYGSAKLSYVYPATWHADVFLANGNVPFVDPAECANPNVEWRWTVAQSALVTTKPRAGCKTFFKAKRLGKYALTAKRFERTGPTAPFTDSGISLKKQVEIKDWVIVGMGDSNGSGEGNPPWIYRRCNRSRASYQFQTARFLEEQDPHSSVTFIFTACSGARVEHLVFRPYAGTRGGNPPLPPQLDQVHTLLTPPSKNVTKRRVDAALISIGVNDLSFGPVGVYCGKHPSLPGSVGGGCETHKVKYTADPPNNKYAMVANPKSKRTLNQQVLALQKQLPGRFKKLRGRLIQPYATNRGLGIPLRKVFLTPYPDFSTDEFGNACNTTGLSPSVLRWNTETWEWFGNQSRLLNRNVRRSAANGWQVSPLTDDAFAGHGYCAGGPTTNFAASYIRGIFKASLRDDDAAGPLHPTFPGHQLEANAQSGQLCGTLYLNPVCVGKWR